MLDKSMPAVHKFWYEYDKRVLYRIVAAMEGIESWAADTDPLIDDALVQLGQALQQSTDLDDIEEASIVKVFANIRLGRALRLMQFLDTLEPGTASKLLIYAEDHTKEEGKKDPYADLFLKRNLAFERLQLLVRVFAPERMNLVLKALESYHE